MTTDPLLERLSGLPWPHPRCDQPELAVGQLWRGSWGPTTCLIVVLETPQDRYVLVAAASSEPFGDEHSLTVQTDVDLMPVAWGSVTASIKLFTLEHRLGDLTTESLGHLRQTVANHGTSPHWPRISSPLDDRILERAELEDSLLRLAEAEWAPQASVRSLADQATAAGIDVVDVRKALNIPPGEARNLLMDAAGCAQTSSLP